MNRRGGYRLNLSGRPTGRIDRPGDPDHVRLELSTDRLACSRRLVDSARPVESGQAIACDPNRFDLPLRAPAAGTIHFDDEAGQAVIENPVFSPPRPVPAETAPETLVQTGAWACLANAATGELPDPKAEPAAVIVSTVDLDAHCARGDVLLGASFDAFLEGLERVQSLLDYQPIHLVLPDRREGLALQLAEALSGRAWVKLSRVPLRYGLDHPAVVARRLGYRPAGPVVWATDVAGVLAVGRALATGLPVTRRVVAVGGPAAEDPRHLDVCLGHPVHDLAPGGRGRRVVRGGVMTGRRILAPAGVTLTTCGLTVLPDVPGRKLLGFARPGWSSRSYSRWYLSVVRGWFAERLTTALRGERRACVACGHCRKVCPAGLWPQWIHKALYGDDLDEAETLGVDLCIGCGLCSFVCPSKIELAEQFAGAREALAVDRELQGAMH